MTNRPDDVTETEDQDEGLQGEVNDNKSTTMEVEAEGDLQTSSPQEDDVEEEDGYLRDEQEEQTYQAQALRA